MGSKNKVGVYRTATQDINQSIIFDTLAHKVGRDIYILKERKISSRDIEYNIQTLKHNQ